MEENCSASKNRLVSQDNLAQQDCLASQNEVIPIQDMIYEVRGQKVMFDSDLAKLYGVEVKVLNQAVKRNKNRFPPDFMFQLTQNEWDFLRSQFVTAKANVSKVRYMPYVFTEQGVAMLSSVIKSERAIEVNINIMRAFIQLRHYMLSQTDIYTNNDLRKLLMLHIDNCENKFTEYDKTIDQIINVFNNLMGQPKKTRPIGFTTGE